MRKPFQDARERIHRADEHFTKFAQVWNGLLEDDPYRVYVSVDPDGQGRIEVEPLYDPLPIELSLELGEGLYQLRAALDAAVRAAAIIDSGQDPPPDEEYLEFPVTNGPKHFQASARKIGPLANYRKWMIESIQPYNIVKDLAPGIQILSPHRSIRMLHDWARIDRHRRLHVAGSWAANRDPWLILPDGVRLTFLGVTADGFLEGNYEVATFNVEGWERGMDIHANPNLTIDIALREEPPPAADNDTLAMRVKMLKAFVSEVVEGLDESFDSHPPAHAPEGLP